MKKYLSAIYFTCLFALPNIFVSGQSQFQKIYRDELGIEFFIDRAANGDIFTASNSYDINSSVLNRIVVQRLNQKGQSIFTKSLYKVGGKSFRLSVIKETPDNGLLLAGSFADHFSDNDSVFVIKLDDKGIIMWDKRFQFDEDIHTVTGIKKFADGAYVIYGLFDRSKEFSSSIFLVKLDASGNKLWTHEVNSEMNGAFLKVGGIVEENNGDFWLCGSTRFNTEGSWAASFNSKGELGSVMFYDTHKLTDSQPEPIAMFRRSNGDRDIFYNKTSYKDGSAILVLRTDVSGKPLMTNVFSFNHVNGGTITSVHPYGTDGYILSGYHYPNTSYRPDGVAFELDAQNNIKWSKSYGTSYIEYLSGIVPASDGGFFLGGFADFDSTIGSPGENGLLCWLVKTDANGNTNCYTNDLTLSSKTLNTNSKAYSLEEKTRDDIQNGTWANFDLNLVLDSVSCIPASLRTVNENKLNIYPNPTIDKISIEAKGLNGELLLYDGMGRLILGRKIQNSSIEEIELPDVKGIYLLIHISEEGHSLHRILKN